MEDSGDTAAISLASAMVLGLLDELSGIDNPLIVQFCNILAEHPVSRTSRTRSLGPSIASIGQLTGSVLSSSDMHEESVTAPATSDATSIVSDLGPVQQPSPETKDNQGSDDEVDDSNVTCKEDYRFLVVAPTGAAAALLNGSTYHSVLGINDGEFISAKSLAQIRAKLDKVDYIFLDEVSMLSCHDLYKISSQCVKARGEHNEPFGGINFIFAGDFTQLPPAMNAPPLYSGNVSTQVESSQTVRNQEAAIDKALWHQVTTVVILRQNMRQDKQSPDDTKLRTALENIRYKSCTLQDIAFLRTRISGKGPDDPKLVQKAFRNVSIITAFNAQKDKINQLSCERFAAENNQTLTSFYSIDRWKDPEISRKKKRY